MRDIEWALAACIMCINMDDEKTLSILSVERQLDPFKGGHYN